jgi:energy-coupling factor transport system permease protein
MAKTSGKEIFSTIKFVAVILIFVSLFNMIFSHYGIDVLFTIGNTEFTLEALFYGFNQGMVLSAVIVWFTAFSRLADSERVVYIFRLAPKCALIFSMVLGFIPRFTKKLKDIQDAQTALYGGQKQDKKLKQALSNFSALISYSLESSIITADSMTARGYNPKAVQHSRFKINIYDIIVLILCIGLSSVIITQKISGNIVFVFEPVIYVESFSTVALISFAVFELLPFIIDVWEDVLWKVSSAKI